MKANTVVTAMCTYRVKRGDEGKFETLLKSHWPALRKLNLVTEAPSQMFRGSDEGGTYYVEILDWWDADAPNQADSFPEVMRIWEPMGSLVESRDKRPAMEFPLVSRLARS
jgi:hypothetical protein